MHGPHRPRRYEGLLLVSLVLLAASLAGTLAHAVLGMQSFA